MVAVVVAVAPALAHEAAGGADAVVGLAGAAPAAAGPAAKSSASQGSPAWWPRQGSDSERGGSACAAAVAARTMRGAMTRRTGGVGHSSGRRVRRGRWVATRRRGRVRARLHPPYRRGGCGARLSLRAGPLEEEPGPREADLFVVPRGAVDRGGEDFEGATMRVGEGRHGTGDRVRRCFHHSLQRREPEICEAFFVNRQGPPSPGAGLRPCR